MPDAPVSPQRLEYLRLRKRRRRSILIFQLLLLIFFFGQWELTAALGWVDAFIVSCPSRIIATFSSLYASGYLWLHIGTSCYETVLGFTLGSVTERPMAQSSPPVPGRESSKRSTAMKTRSSKTRRCC